MGRVAIAVAMATAAMLILVAASGPSLGAAGGSSGSDPPDAGGPLDLGRVRLSQDGRGVRFVVKLRGELPPLHELARFPSHVESADERYLCLDVEGRRLGRRLLCVGGHVRGGNLTLGESSYGDTGATRRLGRVDAQAVGVGRSKLQLRLPLRSLGSGRLRWTVASGWTSSGCVPTPGDEDKAPQHRATNTCLDRAPGSGFYTLRIHPVRRVGCTSSTSNPITSGPSRRKWIALTFDDGPSSYTSSVMQILDHRHAKGTFFEVGSQVPGRSEVMNRLLEHGHEIGNHSLGHEINPGAASIAETGKRIEQATGFRPCLFRPPYGAAGPSVVDAARANRVSTVLWDVDTVDWAMPGSGTIYDRAVSGAHPGAIILMHDGGGPRGDTVAALPHIVDTLRSRGYHLVTVTKLLGERYIYGEVR